MNGRTNVVNNNSDSLGGIIPLEAPNTFVVVADNAKCLLTWTDPKDKYADELGEITDEGDQLVSQFAYTRIVRKTTGYPSGPNDGDIVTESSTRNQYQSTAYSDEGLVNNTMYYYAAFTCNTDGVWSGSVTGSATPKAYDPILANNTWEQINEVALAGFASSVWEIGDEKELNINNENHTILILDFNHDDLSDGSGKAAITFGMKNTISTRRQYHGNNRNGSLAYHETNIYSWINSTLYNTMSDVSKYIPKIKKQSHVSIAKIADSVPETHNDTVSIALLSVVEVGLSMFDKYVGNVSTYPYFETTSNRIKHRGPSGTAVATWALRDTHADENYGMYGYDMIYAVGTNGNLISLEGNESAPSNPENYFDITICFCIGKTPS